MLMRVAILGAALAASVAVPVPAMARETRSEARSETRGSRAMDQLSDPRTQQAMAGAMAAMTEALLDIKIAPFINAMERMGGASGARKSDRHIDRDATLGDMAGPDARRMPREVARKMPQMMGAAAGMAGAVEAMLPQLAAMGAVMAERMRGAMDAPAGRDSEDQSDREPPAGEAQAE